MGLEFLADWCSFHGLQKYHSVLAAIPQLRSIDDLLELTAEDLTSNGIRAIGARRKILAALEHDKHKRCGPFVRHLVTGG